MADRRMMSKKIIHSDGFMDLPASTKNLYFYLMIEADDDGFMNSPKRTQRMIGSSDDDASLLIAKKFIITFDSGVIVIKHWRIHNYIRGDRYKETDYLEEKGELSLKDNLVYQKDTIGTPTVDIGKDRLGKDRLGKDRLGKDRTMSSFENFIELLKRTFTSYKISTFSAKINKTTKTKEAFNLYEVIPDNLHIRYTEYVIVNRNKSARLDKWLMAVVERNEKDIDYSDNQTSFKGKQPDRNSIAWRMAQKETDLDEGYGSCPIEAEVL